MRTVQVDNKKILANLQEKDTLTKLLTSYEKESKDLEAKINKAFAQLARTDEKTRPEIDRERSKLVMGEYEQLSRVFLDNNTVKFEIADRFQEFKDNFEKNKK